MNESKEIKMELNARQVEDLEYAAQDADFDLSQIRWDYSGRFMYGRTCLGITGSSRDLMRFALLVMPMFVDELQTGDRDVIPQVPDEWFDVRSDDMGRDTIFYWPSISVPQEARPDRLRTDLDWSEPSDV